MRSLLTIAAAAFILAPATASASGMISNEINETVAHDDLDLTTQDGVARLDERVRTIIRRACFNSGRDGASLRLERECRASAFAEAAHQIRFAVAEANADRVQLAANPSKSLGSDTPGA